jgi:hypothetical protein
MKRFIDYGISVVKLTNKGHNDKLTEAVRNANALLYPLPQAYPFKNRVHRLHNGLGKLWKNVNDLKVYGNEQKRKQELLDKLKSIILQLRSIPNEIPTTQEVQSTINYAVKYGVQRKNESDLTPQEALELLEANRQLVDDVGDDVAKGNVTYLARLQDELLQLITDKVAI